MMNYCLYSFGDKHSRSNS